MRAVLLLLFFATLAANGSASSVRLKDLARIEGKREVALVGYGLVVGLSGSGDTMRSKATLQSLANTLERFGLEVDQEDLSARNVAAVMVTSELPPFSEPGDRVDLRVASTGDARSLAGGTLLLTALYGPDNRLYALGQGALTVGGYHVESFNTSVRKNHATVGHISNGGSVERSPPDFAADAGTLTILLNEPDYTTANRMVERIDEAFKVDAVFAQHPGKIVVRLPQDVQAMPFIAALENISVSPDVNARVIVNERTGTIVAGGNVTLGEVSIAHGNLRIEIQTDYEVSQPQLLVRPGAGIETAVVPNTSITVVEDDIKPVQLPGGTTVAELVQALYQIRVSTRDTISILEAAKAAGALHADLIIQ
jgi:flagellar P-ring protein precursor FlgI